MRETTTSLGGCLGRNSNNCGRPARRYRNLCAWRHAPLPHCTIDISA